MTNGVNPHNEFEAKLTEAYGGSLTAINHQADLIRELAVAPFRHLGLSVAKKNILAILPSGDIVFESLHACHSALGDDNAIFTLAFQAAQHIRKRRWRKNETYHDLNIVGKEVSLIINHEFDRPAALIGPSSAELSEYGDPPRSAEVVVHDEVNNPAHLVRLLPIVAVASLGEHTAHSEYPHLFSGEQPSS
jgi:hypothetical protein